MTFTLTLAWWHLPLVCTVISLVVSLFWPTEDQGMFSGIATLFRLLVALVISLLAWAIAGALK